MLSNHVYNLMAQLLEESKSLQRIKEDYKADAGECAECVEFWKKLEADKEGHVRELTEMVKTHLS